MEYELEERQCGCGIKFKVLPTSPQTDCGRGECNHSAKVPARRQPVTYPARRHDDVRYNQDVTPTSWEECVKAAKLCVVRIGQYRMYIAKLAMRACDITHGGGGHWNDFEDQRHLGKFAQEIGVNHKTMNEWVATYRDVVLKLPPNEREMAMEDGNYKAVRRVKGQVVKNTPKKEVRVLFDQEKQRTHSSEKMGKYCRYMQVARTDICKNLKLDNCKRNEMERIVAFCEDIRGKLRGFLSTDKGV